MDNVPKRIILLLLMSSGNGAFGFSPLGSPLHACCGHTGLTRSCGQPDALTAQIEAFLPVTSHHLATTLLEIAPQLRFGNTKRIMDEIDQHSRLGEIERARHDDLVALLKERIQLSLLSSTAKGDFEIYVDTPLADLQGSAGMPKRSRRVDLMIVTAENTTMVAGVGTSDQSNAQNPMNRTLSMVEVTVVRDFALENRVADKRKKYVDLPQALADSSWARSKRISRVRDPLIVAVGVLGTIPPSTVNALVDLGLLDPLFGESELESSEPTTVHLRASAENGRVCGNLPLKSFDSQTSEEKLYLPQHGKKPLHSSGILEEIRRLVLFHNLYPFLERENKKLHPLEFACAGSIKEKGSPWSRRPIRRHGRLSRPSVSRSSYLKHRQKPVSKKTKKKRR